MYLLRVQELKQYSVGILHYLSSKKLTFEIIVASGNNCFNASPFWRLIDKMWICANRNYAKGMKQSPTRTSQQR